MTIKDVKLAIEELDKEATLVNEELINQKLNMFSQGVIDDLELMEWVSSNRYSWDNANILSGIINRMSKSLFEDKHIFTRIIEIAYPFNIGDIYRRSNGMYNNDRSLMLEILTKSPSTIEKVNSTLLFDEEFIKQAILKKHDVLKYLPKKYSANKELIIDLLNGEVEKKPSIPYSCIYSIDLSLLNDKDFLIYYLNYFTSLSNLDEYSYYQTLVYIIDNLDIQQLINEELVNEILKFSEKNSEQIFDYYVSTVTDLYDDFNKSLYKIADYTGGYTVLPPLDKIIKSQEPLQELHQYEEAEWEKQEEYLYQQEKKYRSKGPYSEEDYDEDGELGYWVDW